VVEGEGDPGNVGRNNIYVHCVLADEFQAVCA
jgi:hypothetical protein